MWYVLLKHPKREELLCRLPHLGARIERPIEHWHRHVEVDEWRTLTYGWVTHYIEEYTIVWLDNMHKRAIAEYTKLRRSHELARTFNPARLPA